MDSWLDSSAHPLHRIAFPRRYDLAEVDRQFSLMTQHLAGLVGRDRKTKVGIVVDISQPETSSAASRKRIASAMAGAQKSLEGHVAAQGFVVRTSLIRAALTGVFWLAHPPWPVKVFTSRAEAEEWVRELLRTR